MPTEAHWINIQRPRGLADSAIPAEIAKVFVLGSMWLLLHQPQKPLRGVGFLIAEVFSVHAAWSTLLSRGGSLMSTKENVALMRRWFEEVWNQGKIETVHELLAEDAIGVGQAEPGVEIHGPADFIPFVHRIRGAFPDIKVTVEDAFGARDQVVLRWSATMTHTGNHLGIPASGKPVRITGMSMVRIRDGKIVVGWDNWDQLAMMQQIGAYEHPRTTAVAKTA